MVKEFISLPETNAASVFVIQLAKTLRHDDGHGIEFIMCIMSWLRRERGILFPGEFFVNVLRSTSSELLCPDKLKETERRI